MSNEAKARQARLLAAMSRANRTATTMHRMGRELTRARNAGGVDGPVGRMLSDLHAHAVEKNREAENDLAELANPDQGGKVWANLDEPE